MRISDWSSDVCSSDLVTQKHKPLSTIQVNGPIPAAQARSIIEESLREAILDGRLPCGTALRQQELADLFGVSRIGRKSVVEGKSVSVRVDLGGRRLVKKKNKRRGK